MSNARAGYNKGLYYSNIVSPMKVDIQFTVAATDSGGLGITSLKSNGYVQALYMHTSATPATGSPNPATGQGLIILKNNFNAFLGADYVIEAPLTGSALAINGSALTANAPYQITTVGAVPKPVFTVSTVADSSGSLAGTYFTFTDQLLNNYVVYYIVAGVGSQPSLTGSLAGYIAIPVAIASGDSANTVATATRTALAAASNVTISGATNAVIITGNGPSSNVQFGNLPSAGTSGFSVSAITWVSLAADWHVVGFPLGFTPSVGSAFFASATGGATNTTGRVKALTVSGVDHMEILGVSNQLISNSNLAANAGANILFQFVTGGTVTNPTDGSIVSMSLYFDQSSVTVDGL